MDSPTVEAGTNTRKPTAIPRLNKKSSCDSALRCSNDHQDDNSNPVNRSSSDPSQPTSRSDKSKKIGKFTLKEQNGRNDDRNPPGNSETDDEINSTIFNGRLEEKIVKCETKRESLCIQRDGGRIASEEEDVTVTQDRGGGGGVFANQMNQTSTSLDTTNSCLSSNGTVMPGLIECASQTVPPLQMQNIRKRCDDERVLRNRLSPRGCYSVQSQTTPKRSLKEAYLKQVQTCDPTFDQCKWNAINPMYKNIAFDGNKFNSNIKGAKEESSDIDTDDEAVFDSPKASPQSNVGLYKLYKALTKDKEKEATLQRSLDNKRETLVNAFLEVFGDDSHIVQKLRDNTLGKNEAKFNKFKGDRYPRKNTRNRNISTIQEDPAQEMNKSKLIEDIYKNDDVFSTVTQSSNDIWSCHSSPKRSAGSRTPRPKSSVSLKSCGCEIKHLQLNDVQNSITDIHKAMRMMLANLVSTSNEEITLELIKLRTLYDESLSFHKKLMMQNRKLQNDVQKLCTVVGKVTDGKKSGSVFKFFVLPILGAVTYFVVTHFDLCRKFRAICEI